MKVVDANRPMKRMGPAGASAGSYALTASTTCIPSGEPSQSEAKDSSATSTPTPTSNQESESTSISETASKIDHITNTTKSTLKEELNLTSVMKEKASNRVSSTNRRAPKRNSDGLNRKNTNGTNPGRKVAGCRACSGCLADDCGKCHYCLDKPKFGGGNTLKKKCVTKRCLMQSHKIRSPNGMRKN